MWLAAGVVVVAGAAVAAYFLFLRKPGNVSNPNVEFTAPSPRKPIPTGHDWPLYGLDAQRTRYLPGQSIEPPYRMVWRFQGSSLIEFQPVLAKGILYVLENNGKGVALSARTGRIVWHRKVGALAAESPAWSGGHVFMVANRGGKAGISSAGAGTVWCLDAKTGRVIWKKKLASASESSPLISGGRVFLGSQDGTVYALDARSGAIRWRWHAGGAVKAAIAIAQGRLFVGDYSGGMTALSPGSGRVIWHSSTSGLALSRSGNFYATPAIAFGRVYAGNTDGFIYSFSARNGQLAWRHSTGNYVYAAPVAAAVPGMKPAIFAGSYSGTFYALDARSGNVIWTHRANGTISGAASLIGKIVYFSTLSQKTTTGLDARTGRVVWNFARGAFNPAISDGLRLYITGYSSLYAFTSRSTATAPATAPSKSSRSARSKRGGKTH